MARTKKSLRADFIDNDCREMWCGCYDLDRFTVRDILNECLFRANRLLQRDPNELSGREHCFVDMVYNWSDCYAG